MKNTKIWVFGIIILLVIIVIFSVYGLSNNLSGNSILKGKTYTININNFAFSEKTLTIQKGDTVIWKNSDSAEHTVTSDSGNELQSNDIGNGESFKYTFDESGTFNYHCIYHPMMKATIIVQ